MRNRVVLIGLCIVLFTAIGAAPRYLEELRIGGGYGEPTDGGADFESNGDLLTNGDLTVDGNATVQQDLYVNGNGILSTGEMLALDPAGAGHFFVSASTAQFKNSGGRLWFVNTAGDTSHFRFYMPDSTSTSQDFGSLWCLVTDPTDGSEDGMFKLALIRNGVYDYDVFSVNSLGDGRFDGDVIATGGDVVAGTAGATRGVLFATRGMGETEAGSIRLQSRNGTSWYLFVEDDGTLRVHSSLPSSNSDGTIVGLQN
jgi:hypothetical protein